MTTPPATPADPCAPAALDALLEPFVVHHRRRLKLLARLTEDEGRLRRSLEVALAGAVPPVERAQVSWLGRLWARLGGAAAPAPPRIRPDELWARHEAAWLEVRALGHQLQTIERDRVVLADQVVALDAAASRLDGPGGEEGSPCDTPRATEAVRRIQSLREQYQGVDEALDAAHQGLEGLHRVATRTLDALGAHLTDEVRDAIAAELSTAEADRAALLALHQTVREVGALADEAVARAGSTAQRLDARLQALDAEVAARRAAREEVERALGRTPR